MIWDDVIRDIERGMVGRNTGIPLGFNKLSEYVPGLQQGTYYLIAAESSVGKSAFADELFLFRAYDFIVSEYNPGLKLKVIYYSLEIDKRIKITKAICRRLYLQYGILTDVNYILSRGRNRVSDEVYEKVVETKKYFEGLEDILDIYDANINPTGIHKQLWEYCEKNGKLDVVEHRTTYTPNNPNLYTFAIVDHAGLVKREQGLDNKGNMDKLSQYMVPLRNICKISPVIIQQLNRSISSTDRIKLELMTPQLSDLKGSGNLGEDANIVFALFSPFRYDMPSYKKYNIEMLRDRYRCLSLIKNRDGESDKSLGLNFIGEIGYFRELPRGDEMSPEDYERAVSYKKIQQKEHLFTNLKFDE